MFWQVQGMKEYEKIYACSFSEELKERDLKKEDREEFQEILKEQILKTSYHFGDPHFNTATLAGIFRMHGRVTKRNVVPYIKVTEYL